MRCGVLSGKEDRKGGDECIRITDLSCCVVGTNTASSVNCTPIKINVKRLFLVGSVELKLSLG